MSEIHEEMERDGLRRAEGEMSLCSRMGVEPASKGTTVIAQVLEILGDGEAHTIGSLSDYLEFAGINLSGCQIAAQLSRLELDGHRIQMLGPYDMFGSPGRFKLLTGEAA